MFLLLISSCLRLLPFLSGFLLFKALYKDLFAGVSLEQELVHVVVRMHEPLNGVDSVVMSEDTVDGGAAVTLASIEHVSLRAWDQAVEKLPDLHVLRDVTRSVTELVLQKGISLGLLDQIDDAFGVTIL